MDGHEHDFYWVTQPAVVGCRGCDYRLVVSSLTTADKARVAECVAER